MEKISWNEYKRAVSDEATIDFNDDNLNDQFKKLSKNTKEFIKKHKVDQVINKTNVSGVEKGRNYYRFTLKDKIIEIDIHGHKVFFHPHQNVVSIPII